MHTHLVTSVTLYTGERITVNGMLYEVTGFELGAVVIREMNATAISPTIQSQPTSKSKHPPHWAKYNDWRKKVRK